MNKRVYLAALGSLVAAGSIYSWLRLRQFAPTRPHDAMDAGHLLLQGQRQVLAFSAHPDDLELLAGGLLRRLHLLGSNITVVDATSGETSRPRSNLGAVRKGEQRRAAAILGYSRVKYLDFSDRSLAHQQGLNQVVKKIWQQHNPDLVLAFDHVHYHPWLRHPDHIALGRAVVHTANELDSNAPVYLYGSARPNVVVDIGPVLGQKIWAVASHRSQFPLLPRSSATFVVKKLAAISARGTPFRWAETFRSLHNIHTFVPPVAKS